LFSLISVEEQQEEKKSVCFPGKYCKLPRLHVLGKLCGRIAHYSDFELKGNSSDPMGNSSQRLEENFSKNSGISSCSRNGNA